VVYSGFDHGRQEWLIDGTDAWPVTPPISIPDISDTERVVLTDMALNRITQLPYI